MRFANRKELITYFSIILTVTIFSFSWLFISGQGNLSNTDILLTTFLVFICLVGTWSLMKSSKMSKVYFNICYFTSFIFFVFSNDWNMLSLAEVLAFTLNMYILASVNLLSDDN